VGDILTTCITHMIIYHDGVSFFLIFRFLEGFPLPQPFLNKLNDHIAHSKMCFYNVPLKELVVSYQDCSLYDLNLIDK
jgi:hypothetical protein